MNKFLSLSFCVALAAVASTASASAATTATPTTTVPPQVAKVTKAFADAPIARVRMTMQYYNASKNQWQVLVDKTEYSDKKKLYAHTQSVGPKGISHAYILNELRYSAKGYQNEDGTEAACYQSRDLSKAELQYTFDDFRSVRTFMPKQGRTGGEIVKYTPSPRVVRWKSVYTTGTRKTKQAFVLFNKFNRPTRAIVNEFNNGKITQRTRYDFTYTPEAMWTPTDPCPWQTF